MQAGWLGGDERQVPRRWEAASPAAHARQIRTPVLLAYAETGALASQGQAWRRALSAAGVPNELILVPGADHVFASGPARRCLRHAVISWWERHR